MSPCALLIPAGIQLAVLIAPIALGLAGVISGAMAGLTSIVAWFALGIPLSYSAVDARARRRALTRPAGEHVAPRSEVATAL